MIRIAIAAALLATAAHAAHPPSADARLKSLEARWLDGEMHFQPESATTTGDHRFDALIGDRSAAGRARIDAAEHGWLKELDAIPAAKLSRANQVDAAMLRNALRYSLWSNETLQDWAWDPQIYNDAAGGALYGLAARDFAPWSVRLKAATSRMNLLPAMLAQARASLDPKRVPLIHAQTVAKQNSGIMDIVDTMLAPHEGELGLADRAAFDAARMRLKHAVDDHQRWLDTVLVPNAKGDFRLGAKLYDEKVAFALDSPLTRAEIKARATAALAATTAEMATLARSVVKDNAGMSDHDVIAAALALTYAKRPARDGVIPEATKALGEATDFVRAKDLITLPTAPVKIIEMPKFQQGSAVAYCDAPGPLDKNLGTFFAVSPIPADWSDKQATSFLSEYNDYMIRDLAVHEAMPGHFVQLAHQNAYPSTLRAVLGSGPFVEGWAVYAEGQMADAGFMGGDPLYRLTVLKMRLRSITNSLLDIGIQTEGMTEDAAMHLMMDGAFQTEREAAGKWTRARLSSTQLLSYFVGYSEHSDLRAAAEKRPGFSVKGYHDQVLSYGSPPVRYVRALMLGEPIAGAPVVAAASVSATREGADMAAAGAAR
ncbi:MAG: DUF885 domain-containing protein [Sphingomonadaceae bacterium]|nr:DUF885 domain-containing protein [Sphingomonadaceae bacterium]